MPAKATTPTSSTVPLAIATWLSARDAAISQSRTSWRRRRRSVSAAAARHVGAPRDVDNVDQRRVGDGTPWPIAAVPSTGTAGVLTTELCARFDDRHLDAGAARQRARLVVGGGAAHEGEQAKQRGHGGSAERTRAY